MTHKQRVLQDDRIAAMTALIRWRRGTETPSEQRFVGHVRMGSGSCWNWVGHRLRGYGRVNNGTRPEHAHRVIYRWFYGPIAAGLEIDHLCSNRSCVNPIHLEAVTHSENVKRAWAKRKAKA